MRRYLMVCIILTAFCVNCIAAVKPVVKPKPNPVPIKPPVIASKPIIPANACDLLMISPSVSDGAQLYEGWPLVLNVTLWRQLPEDEKIIPQPITIKAKSGSWSEALVVTIKNDSGAVTWPLHIEKVEGASLTLGPNGSADVSWHLTPEETKAIPDGHYTISAAFDPKLVDGVPAGSIIDRYHLDVMKEPTALDKDTQEEKDLSFASFDMARGNMDSASAAVDKVIAANPESISGYRMKGRLLYTAGKIKEAVYAFSTALSIYYEKNPNACPPAPLMAERDAVLRKITPETAPAAGQAGGK